MVEVIMERKILKKSSFRHKRTFYVNYLIINVEIDLPGIFDSIDFPSTQIKKFISFFPLFITTTAILPSKFWKAVVRRKLLLDDAEIRLAPGFMNLEK